ncbi:19246_t:CDS:2, partial [Racocetra persica]
MSIRKFFDKFIDRKISPKCDINIDPFEIIESVELSQSIGTTAIQARFNCEIIEITKMFGVNIHYHLKFNNPTTSHSVSPPNALEILIRNSHKKQIYIPIESADIQGKHFVNCSYEAVWYINMCGHLKFKE